MPNEKVLVVDDDPDILQLVKECLSEAGFEVATAVDGGAARQIARDERPDAIILDVNMPTADSHEVCKTLKNDTALKHIPVIFLMEQPTNDDIITGFSLGAHDFMEKPFAADVMVARVGSAVREKLAGDRLRIRNAKLESLAKHVQAAVQHFEQPRAQSGVAGDTESPDRAPARLTRRELEILQLLAQGLSNEVISRQLYISPTTTRNHIQNILGKLGVHSKLEAVAHAVRAGYVDFVG
jgi:DNA-binding NarL/FixJ family response regulator